MTLPWYDVEMRGRRLEALSKRMTTEFYKALKNNKPELALSYADRILKTDHIIQPYVEQYLGVKKFLKKPNEGTVYQPVR